MHNSFVINHREYSALRDMYLKLTWGVHVKTKGIQCTERCIWNRNMTKNARGVIIKQLSSPLNAMWDMYLELEYDKNARGFIIKWFSGSLFLWTTRITLWRIPKGGILDWPWTGSSTRLPARLVTVRTWCEAPFWGGRGLYAV
jgi:hypothetical protein